MKVLAIIGSRRARGNSFNVTQKIEQHLKELGDVEFENLYLKDVNLGFCRCFFLKHYVS